MVMSDVAGFFFPPEKEDSEQRYCRVFPADGTSNVVLSSFFCKEVEIADNQFVTFQTSGWDIFRRTV